MTLDRCAYLPGEGRIFMAEKGIDRLLELTDSKYRLSVVIAKRALELKAGVPPVIPPEQRVGIKNNVTIAMREMATGKLEWGEDMVDEHRLHSILERTRVQQHESLLAAQGSPASESDEPDLF